MDKPKRKKIFYIPGIISLTLLPIAFFFFAKREIQQSTIWAIPIFLADTAFMNKQDIVFSNFNGNFPPKRNYTDIVFAGGEDDKIKLSYSQIRIREILKANDTLNGLHFIFSDNASYGTFVQTVDMLRIEGAKTYMPLENNLWFYHFQVDTTAKPFKDDCLLCNDVVNMEPVVSCWPKAQEAIAHGWVTSW